MCPIGPRQAKSRPAAAPSIASTAKPCSAKKQCVPADAATEVQHMLRAARLQHHLRELIEPKIAENRGRVVTEARLHQAAARIVPAEEFSAPLITHDTLFQQFSKYVLTMQLKLNILTVVERWKSRQWMISMRSLPWGRLPRKPASRCSGCWSPAVPRGCRLESSQNAWVFSLPHFLSISRSSFMPALSLSDA